MVKGEQKTRGEKSSLRDKAAFFMEGGGNMPSTSIAFNAVDNMTRHIRSMRTGVNDLTRDIQSYRRIQDNAFREKAVIKMDITQAKNALRELSKDVRNNVGGSREAFIEQQHALERLNEEYRRLTQVAREAGREERGLEADIRRTSNAAATRSGGGSSGAGGMISALGKAGLGAMGADALKIYLNTSVTSMFGSNTGGMISDIGGGAAMGAAMGSMMGPPGMAIGAAVGGLTGALQGISKIQTKEDDIFRAEVKSLHTDAMSYTKEKVGTSSEVSGEREVMKKKYETMMGKEEGGKLFEDLKQYGIETPYSTDSMIAAGVQFRQYNPEWNGEDIKKNVDMLGDLALGDQNKFNTMSYAYAQIQSEGKLNGQDWRQMTQAGFNPLAILAEERGKTQSQMRELMSAGRISAADVTHAIEVATGEGGTFYNGADNLMDTYVGISARLEDSRLELDLAAGEAYNEQRKGGKQQEIESLSGENGDILKDAHAKVGIYEAEMDNMYQQGIDEAMVQAAKQIEAEGLVGIEAAKLMWKAKAEAEIEFKNSEESQMKLAAEQGLIADIQAKLIESGDYLDFGMSMANEFSKGWYTGRLFTFEEPEKPRSIFDKGGRTTPRGATIGTDGRHATGLPRVPYDGYRAELHEGERVLTKVESNQKEGGMGGVSIGKIADYFVIREEADIDKIARTLVTKINTARMTYGG